MRIPATIKGWFLHSIDYFDAPQSMAELYSRFEPNLIEAKKLVSASKWEPLIQGRAVEEQLGWVPLADLATTRRGIATGANGFFLLSSPKVTELGLPEGSLVPCVGRANDVQGLVFDESDFTALKARGGKCLLLDIKGDPDIAEVAYIKSGEAFGLTERYILANRAPWYSMEQREPAPIWASVFGRGDLKFVFNAASAKSLTNFHCVYPIRKDAEFGRALAMTLNSRAVRYGSRLHTRGYGGGLTKFEPNDLKSILVPDLRAVSGKTITMLSEFLDQANDIYRRNLDDGKFQDSVSELIVSVGQEAIDSSRRLL
jgi:adenine-specific DNA-methyltransferase